MNLPHQFPHQPAGPDPLGDAISQLRQDLNREVDRSLAQPGILTPPSTPARPADRPPVASGAAPRSSKWGPSTTRITAPLASLENVALSAYELHGEVEGLLAGLTGEQRQKPLGPRPLSTGPLLPGIVALATEIEAVLNEVKRLVEHMQGRI